MAGPYTDCDQGVAISEINAWATGYLDYLPSDPLDPDKYGQYTPGGGVAPMFQTPDYATGEADGAIVTLGDLYQER